MLSRIVAVALLLLSLKIITTPCDEDCSAESPMCECVCICYGKDMAKPAIVVLPALNVAQHALRIDSSSIALTFLVTDIFRPPIAC